MTRVLITGASGNVGGETARACAAAGSTVRVAQRQSTSGLPQGASETIAFDFEQPQTWAAALADCQSVFLMRPPPIADVKATLNPFIERAYEAGVGHIVFLSVVGAERMSWIPHRKVELHLEQLGRGFTVLRAGFFAQNFQDAYRADIVEDGRVYVPAARGRVAFLDVTDVGDVAAHVLRDPRPHDGRALELTGPDALTFDEAVTQLSRVLGRRIAYEPATLAGYAWHLKRRRQLPLAQVLVQTILHAGLRRGDAENVSPVTLDLLGRPARSLASYFERCADRWGSP
jgi:uncharacterized protein YbjT (DUF2867 family)